MPSRSPRRGNGEHGFGALPNRAWALGLSHGAGQLYDSMLRDGLNDAFSDEASGWHTEDLVGAYQVTREEQDEWALRSQQRFARRKPRANSSPRLCRWKSLAARADAVCNRRAQPARHNHGRAQGPQASLSRGRDHHRRQCAWSKRTWWSNTRAAPPKPSSRKDNDHD